MVYNASLAQLLPGVIDRFLRRAPDPGFPATVPDADSDSDPSLNDEAVRDQAGGAESVAPV